MTRKLAPTTDFWGTVRSPPKQTTMCSLVAEKVKEVDIESAMRRLDEMAGSMARLEQHVEDLPAREVKATVPSPEKQEGDLLDAVVRRLEGEGLFWE